MLIPHSEFDDIARQLPKGITQNVAVIQNLERFNVIGLQLHLLVLSVSQCQPFTYSTLICNVCVHASLVSDKISRFPKTECIFKGK